LPDDDGLLGTMISNICYDNARSYIGLPDLIAAKKSAGKSQTH